MSLPRKSLRVAVFGITRSGKDYGISKAMEALRSAGLSFEHIPGIPTVRSYSMPTLGKEFPLTTMGEKGMLMSVFRKRISDREAIPFLIQDEHFSFPTTYGGEKLSNEYTSAKFPFVLTESDEGRVYEVMLEEDWVAGCDAVFYLKPKSETVLRRIRSSEGAKKNERITLEDVRAWMDFEVASLEGICMRLGVPFELIEGDDGAWRVMSQRVSAIMGADAQSDEEGAAEGVERIGTREKDVEMGGE